MSDEVRWRENINESPHVFNWINREEPWIVRHLSTAVRQYWSGVKCVGEINYVCERNVCCSIHSRQLIDICQSRHELSWTSQPNSKQPTTSVRSATNSEKCSLLLNCWIIPRSVLCCKKICCKNELKKTRKREEKKSSTRGQGTRVKKHVKYFHLTLSYKKFYCEKFSLNNILTSLKVSVPFIFIHSHSHSHFPSLHKKALSYKM